MKRYFLFIFVLYFFSVFSENQEEDFQEISLREAPLSADFEPLLTVGGCVNALSGHFFQREKDLKGNTIDPLDFIRTYDSGSQEQFLLGYGFAMSFPLWASDLIEGGRHSYAAISEREGFLIPYRTKESGPSNLFFVDPDVLKKGYTNFNQSAISGHANFANWRAIFSKEGWILRLGDGTIRTYSKGIKLAKDQRGLMRFPTKWGYLLTKEKKPNGNSLLFSYEKIRGKERLTNIKTVNQVGETINELFLHHTLDGVTLCNPYGESVFYEQKKAFRPFDNSLEVILLERKFLNKVTSSQRGAFEYEMQDLTYKLKKIHGPKRSLEISYYPSQQVRAVYKEISDSEKIKCYEFRYFPRFTEVKNCLGEITLYHFDENRRLSCINYLENGSPIRLDCFEWTEEGWLKHKACCLKSKIYSKTSYSYDKRGNVIKESLIGDLTGEKKEDEAITYYKYSEDGRNLLTEKRTADGVIHLFSYQEGTNLCTKTLSYYCGKIQERVFRSYDENGQIKTLIEDDGSSEEESDLIDVTWRKMKCIEAVKQKGASFGKPEKMSDYFLDKDSGCYKLLKEAFLEYDKRGCECKKSIFDSKANLCYTITQTYDERLLLKEETDALGQIKRYSYDESGNKIEEELVGSGKKTLFEYDKACRLIKMEEIHESGEVFTTVYEYSGLDQLISKKDPYGHQVSYTYDRLGNETSCTQVPLFSISGEAYQIKREKKYNLLNQMVREIDENGHTTKYSYNLYGKKTKTIYPDGTKELFTYTPSGLLKEAKYPDGASIHYHYDPKGRITQKTLFFKGEKIKQESYCYKGPLLISQTDSIGTLTTFTYDGAKRKIVEKIGDLKTIYYTYDDFDRLIKKQEEERQELFEYDSLDRLILKTLQDEDRVYSKESYTYDIFGNIEEKSIWQDEERIATFSSHYGSDGELLLKEDPLGKKEAFKTNHHFIDSNGLRVQQKECQESLGRVTQEIKDPLERTVQKEIYKDGTLLSKTLFDFDPKGNLKEVRSFVLADGKVQRIYCLLYSYNQRGLVEEEKEMPSGKRVLYFYDERGRLKEKKKGDGVSLFYTYDPLGRKKSLSSSDGSVSYLFFYDLKDNITKVEDLIHQRIQTRSFDPYNRLEKEELSPGVAIQYSYDSLDRVTKMTLPDSSFFTYSYDSFHLKKVERFNTFGESLYEISLPLYDLRGNLLKIQTPASLIHYSYDLLGRAKEIISPHFESKLTQFDLNSNLLKMEQKDPSGPFQAEFSYDGLNQLEKEQIAQPQTYTYDSLGNCLKNGSSLHTINCLNQIESDGTNTYSYDLNGNLIKDAKAAYSYDALDRLISCEREGKKTSFYYDSFGRLLEIKDSTGKKNLLYQETEEIGSLINGKIEELRLLHREKSYDLTLAIELKGKVFFPIQDFRGNICALQKEDGSIAAWTRYSAFGKKETYSNGQEEIINPWQFANKREILNLTLFQHRFYNPFLMRWQTPDPLGFKGGLNLYTYLHNHPFCYKDLDGQFAIAIPLFTWIGGKIITITLAEIGYALGAAGIFLALNNIDKLTDKEDLLVDEVEEDEKNKRPPYCGEKLGDDPTKCPGDGFKWRGREGPETGKGSWIKDYKQPTQESLHPDIKHLPPKAPHWDYYGPNHLGGVELYLDGTWKFKDF